MAKKQKYAYWLLLTAALCAGTTLLAAPATQARYVNTASWYTVAEPAGDVVTSDCLEAVSRPPVTVLLGSMALEPREISFTLDSRADLSGKLNWTVDQPEYMNVSLRIGTRVLNPGDLIGLSRDIPVTVVMTLTPTELAAQPREEMTVGISVNWRDTLAGTFQIGLEPVEGQEEPTIEETPGAEPAVEEPKTETEPSGETEVQPLSQETTPDSTEPSTEPITEPTTEPTEPTTEPTQDPSEPTEPTEEPTEPTEPETEPTEPTAPSAEVLLEAPDTYHAQSNVPLKITPATDGRICLSLGAGEEIRNFPRGTRYSLDNGNSYYLLYQEGTITLDVLAAVPQTLLLDLTHTILAGEESLTITDGSASVTVTAQTDPLCTVSTKVLTEDGELVLDLNAPWQDSTLTYSLEMLTAGESGKVFVPMELSQDSLWAEETGNRLVLSIGKVLPPPGTYRVCLSWSRDGLCLGKFDTFFFINYEMQNDIEKTGGAEP